MYVFSCRWRGANLRARHTQQPSSKKQKLAVAARARAVASGGADHADASLGSGDEHACQPISLPPGREVRRRKQSAKSAPAAQYVDEILASSELDAETSSSS